MTFDLTLKPYENLLNGIVMYEPINRPLLEKLINSDLLKETFRNPLSLIKMRRNNWKHTENLSTLLDMLL